MKFSVPVRRPARILPGDGVRSWLSPGMSLPPSLGASGPILSVIAALDSR